jgi:hypothetical protein
MWTQTRYPALAFILSLAAVGCDDTTATNKRTEKSDASTDTPLYAMMTQVYSDDDRTVYLSLSDSVDVKKVDLHRE